MNGRRWSVLSSKGQLSTARLLPRASICVWLAVWVGFSAESAMANLEPNRSGSANNVSMTSSWHTYSSSHNFVRPPSPAPILTGQAKLNIEGSLSPNLCATRKVRRQKMARKLVQPKVLVLVALVFLLTMTVAGQQGAKNGEWRVYGGDSGSTPVD